jgi:hypothetical protein
MCSTSKRLRRSSKLTVKKYVPPGTRLRRQSGMNEVCQKVAYVSLVANWMSHQNLNQRWSCSSAANFCRRNKDDSLSICSSDDLAASKVATSRASL